MRRWLFAVCLVASSGSGSMPGAAAQVPDKIRKMVCAAEPCGGEMSSITVYRDASGEVKRLLRLYGRCSHNAAIYFDADGKETEIIPQEPVESGSQKAKQLQAKRDTQVAGLTKAETLDCR